MHNTMTWRAFFEGLGDFLQWTFGIIELLGQGLVFGVANVFWMIVIAALILYWLGQMRIHAKNGEQ